MPLRFAFPVLAVVFAAVWFGAVAPGVARSSEKIAAATMTSDQMVATR